MGLIRSVSGVRGIVGVDLDTAVVFRYVAAFAALQPPGPILLARDSRPHGKSLTAAAFLAIKNDHRRAVLADIIPTPTVQFIVKSKRLAGGVMLTASHNPIEYNGLKFIGADGCFLGREQVEILFARAEQVEAPAEEKMAGAKVRGSELAEAAGLHILSVLDLTCIDREAILRRKFRVVVDAVNGAAYFALPTLLTALGCEVICINCQPDGRFPRGAEPTPQHLQQLGAEVLRVSADLGLASDPDGDRLALVDERGEPIGEEYTQVLATAAFLHRTGSTKPVTTNLSSSMLLERVCAEYGVPVQRTAVGEVNVVNAMQASGGEIGGEGNGGVILSEAHLGRDSLVGAALVLDRLTWDQQPLSKVVSALPKFHMIKTTIQLSREVTSQRMESLRDAISAPELNDVDGLKFIFSDRWVHVRTSNTEPVVRIIAESETESGATQLVEQARAVLSGKQI